ncbi:hypothetical protein [Pedobacter gandavensis]|uniref:hypothetical protein n=1 Tax=Pedobacter gandavensis TaxID=2679963 RepID=UPI00292EC6C7|nr:hypothetical protein [Pedobacter gandavensis]
MKRRELIKGIGLVAGALSISGSAMATESVAGPKKRKGYCVLHTLPIKRSPV